jgi:T-complex protein 1 subunit theta
MRNMRRGVPNLFKAGTSHLSGIDEAVLRNLAACKDLEELLRTSFGPQGMNKMIINHLGKMFVTSDTATILSELEIQHAAAKMVVMAGKMQEQEVGDGSNLVIVFAGELLRMAEDLIYQGLKPQDIIAGYATAAKKAQEIATELIISSTTAEDLFKEEAVAMAVKSAVASKQFGYETLLSQLVAKAAIAVMPKNTFNFNVDNVRVAKLLGGDIHSSYVVRGMVFPFPTLPSAISSVKDARIAVFTCPIDAAETETKGKALLNSATELMDFNRGEEQQIEALIAEVKNSGVNVIVTGGSVSDMAAHFMEKHGIVCMRLGSKFELRRLCRAIGARPLVSLGAVAAENQGFCSHVYVQEVGLTKLTVFEQAEQDTSAVATIVLRAQTFNMLNDVERAIDDGVNTVKAMGRERGGHFLAGAGAFEVELYKRMTEYAATVSGLQQYSINKFAEALLVIPRTLSENAGQNATETVASLIEAHENGDKNAGVNIEAAPGEKTILDASKAHIFDLFTVKASAIRLVFDAVSTILRVDQIIQCKTAGGPKLPQNRGHWDEED